MQLGGNKKLLFLAISGIAAAEFLVDIHTPLGVSDWVWYFIPLLLSVQVGRPVFPYLLAGLFSILILAGFNLSPPGVDRELALIGRLVGISALWLMAVLISQRKQVEEKSRRTERALKALTDCNQALVRASDEAALLNEICRVIVEKGGYRMSWVGFAENDADKSVRIAGCAGCDEGYLQAAKISWSDADERGRGPTGQVIRTGLMVVCNDFQSDPAVAPWHAEAAKRGYAASITLPLRHGGRAFGVLCIYASATGVFTGSEVELLSELADDLAFGIHALRTRAEHALTEAALRDSEQNYREIFNATNEAIFLHEANSGKILDVNDAMLRMYGCASKAEALASTIADRSANEPAYSQAEVERYIHRTLKEGPQVFEWRARKQNGELFWVEVSLRSSQIGEHGRILAVVRDITSRKQAESALRESERLLRTVIDLVPHFIFVKDSQSRHLLVNKACAAANGLTPEQMVGLTDLDCVPDQAQAEAFMRDDREVIASGRAKFIAEEKLITVTGEVRILQTVKIPFNFPGPNDPAVMGVAIDITNLKQAEAVQRETQQKLEAALASMTDAVFISDAEGKFIELNDAFATFHRFKNKAECLQTLTEYPDILDVFSADGKLTPLEMWAVPRALRGETVANAEYTLRRKDTGETWVGSYSFSPIRSADGKVIGSVVVGRDITETKKAEMQLRQLSRAVEQSPVSIVITNLKGEIEYVNPKFTEVTGYTFAEAYSQNPRVLKSGQMPPEFYRQLWQTISSGHEWRGEFLNKKKTGETYWEMASISPINDAAGKITGYVAVKDDITRDKLTEEKIHEQAEMLTLAHDAITIRDLDGRITYWNHGAERIYGWSQAEAIGQIAGPLLKLDQFKTTEAHRQLLENGYWLGEFTARTKNGHEVLVESTWTLVRDAQGQPKSIFTTSVDITEARKLEQQVARSQRIESLGTLASGVAHDLNNILTPIMVSIGLLKEQTQDPMLLRLLTSLDSSTQRGAQLVKQILTFGRGVNGERSPLSLREVAREIQQLVQETFPKSIQFEIIAPDNLWLVNGDHTQLHKVFLNLAINARDAMPNGGKLTFTFQNHAVDAVYAGLNPEAKPGANVLIQVADTGTGIPKEIIDRIFDPFFTTKTHGQGTGLGLSTTLGIVKSHGGFINVYSEPSKGTTFKIYLPARANAEQSEQQAIAQDGMPRGRDELILFVDDEAAIATTVKKILERHGYRVVTAANGAEAVSIYAARGPEIAVVITDMHMPIMDGPATIIALLSMNPRVKIIGSSGLAANGGVAKAASSGVRYFVPKPYTAEQMLRTLREILDGGTDTKPSV